MIVLNVLRRGKSHTLRAVVGTLQWQHLQGAVFFVLREEKGVVWHRCWVRWDLNLLQLLVKAFFVAGLVCEACF